MTAIKMEQLRSIIVRAYEEGHRGCLEMKDEFAEELAQEVLAEMSKVQNNKDWKVYTVEQLRQFDIGTFFNHSRLGKCWIDGKERMKTVTFERGDTMILQSNTEPWNEPMQLVGRP